MCSQLACMNMAVRILIQLCPASKSAGIKDHFGTNTSAPLSTNRQNTTFTRMIAVVTTGKLLGRRDASFKGIKPPKVPASGSRDARQRERNAPVELVLNDTPGGDFSGQLRKVRRSKTPKKIRFGLKMQFLEFGGWVYIIRLPFSRGANARADL